jgi:hypothetical protein
MNPVNRDRREWKFLSQTEKKLRLKFPRDVPLDRVSCARTTPTLFRLVLFPPRIVWHLVDFWCRGSPSSWCRCLPQSGRHHMRQYSAK